MFKSVNIDKIKTIQVLCLPDGTDDLLISMIFEKAVVTLKTARKNELTNMTSLTFIKKK